jgi:hypothetical protein
MKKPEQALHIQVARFLKLVLREPTLWSTFPAGGGGKVRGSFLKAMGLQAGMPDILIFDRGPTINNGVTFTRLIGLELKAGKGRQSDSQKDIARRFEQVGGVYLIARSLDEVEILLRAAGVPVYAKARGGF